MIIGTYQGEGGGTIGQKAKEKGKSEEMEEQMPWTVYTVQLKKFNQGRWNRGDVEKPYY